VIWDSRDLELGLRDKLAQVIAAITSGIPDAIPESDDYELADNFRSQL
jgi:hypothetical protein